MQATRFLVPNRACDPCNKKPADRRFFIAGLLLATPGLLVWARGRYYRGNFLGRLTMFGKLLGCCLAGMLSIAFTWAAEPGAASLYQVSVAMPGEQLAAERNALLLVLNRLTGQHINVTHPEVAQALLQVGALVQGVTSRPNQVLDVQFQADAINRLIQNADAPLWLSPRPSLLVWLVSPSAEQSIIPGDPSTSWPEQFRRQGLVVGLPVNFPLLDLDDVALVNPDVIKQGLMPPLLQASLRYAPGLLLLGELDLQGQVRVLRWTLRESSGAGKALISGQAKGNESEVTAQTLSAVSSYLAERYGKRQVAQNPATSMGQAVSGSKDSAEEVRLIVENISTLDDLLLLQKQLRQNRSIRAFHVESMAGDHVTLVLTLAASEAVVLQTLALEKQLQSVGNEPFHYQWQQP